MIKVSETEILVKMREQIQELDAEDLANLAEHMFGGKFWILDESLGQEWIFELESDENYMGAFGGID